MARARPSAGAAPAVLRILAALNAVVLCASLAGPSIYSLSERNRLGVTSLLEARKFWDSPKLVFHAEADSLNLLRDSVYAPLLLPLGAGGAVLDLCSSWQSHLPAVSCRVEGHGLNQVELMCNPRLDSFFVMDLNEAPSCSLPVQSAAFDLVCCAQSFGYLSHPESVLLEARRALKPGGSIVVSFTADTYRSLAVAGWLGRDLGERADLVRDALRKTGFVEVSAQELKAPYSRPMVAVQGRRPTGETAGEDGEERRRSGVGFFAGGIAAEALPEELRGFSWSMRFAELRRQAKDLGIPGTAMEAVPDFASVDQCKAMMQDVQDMIASRLSSGL